MCFPAICRSSKYLNYKDWKLGFNLIQNKKVSNPEGLNQLITLKNGMNKKREYFDWSHLDKFYPAYI